MQPDEYDIIVRELGFEMKVLPSNRMKTEEELAKEEQDRLQQLEVSYLFMYVKNFHYCIVTSSIQFLVY